MGASDRPGRVLLLIFGGLLTVALIGLGSVNIVGGLAHEETTTTVHFPAGITRVVVRLPGGSLIVRGSGRTDVGGDRTVSRGLATPKIDETIDGDTLTLAAVCPGVIDTWCGVSYRLDVPASLQIEATTGAGEIDVRDTTGDATLSSGSGLVSVDGVSGNLVLDTGSGFIRGSDVRSTAVNAEAGAGLVRIGFLIAPTRVRAHTGAGAVDLTVPDDGAAYVVLGDTGSGDRQVQVNTVPHGDHVIELSTGAGSAQLHYAAH